MISEELLFDLFVKEIDRLGREAGLIKKEKEQIIRVLQRAFKNPYMDERYIFPALIGKEETTA